jgi:hypothetical protein
MVKKLSKKQEKRLFFNHLRWKIFGKKFGKKLVKEW